MVLAGGEWWREGEYDLKRDSTECANRLDMGVGKKSQKMKKEKKIKDEKRKVCSLNLAA